MNINLYYPNNLDLEFAAQVAEKISTQLNNSKNVYLYLSGGSVISTYNQLAKNLLQKKAPFENLTIAQIDERFDINPLHQESNQRIIKDTLLHESLKMKGVVYKYMLNGNKKEIELNIYNQFLSEVLDQENSYHIGIFGVGADSHTGGVKPDKDEDKFNNKFLSKDLCVTYTAADFVRMSLTLNAIEKIDSAFVYMSGNNKKKALNNIIDTEVETQLNLYPNQIFRMMKEVKIFTDIDE